MTGAQKPALPVYRFDRSRSSGRSFAQAFRPPGTSQTLGSALSHVSAPSSPGRGMTLKRHSILPVLVS